MKKLVSKPKYGLKFEFSKPKVKITWYKNNKKTGSKKMLVTCMCNKTWGCGSKVDFIYGVPVVNEDYTEINGVITSNKNWINIFKKAGIIA